MKIITVEQLGLAVQNYYGIENIRLKRRFKTLSKIRKIMYYIAKYRIGLDMVSCCRWLNQVHGLESKFAKDIYDLILSGDSDLDNDVSSILKSLGVKTINKKERYNILFDKYEKIKGKNRTLASELLLERQLNKQLKNELASIKFSLLKTA